jgi:phage shock protein PspC (stress-responsive transcriptional regulator)
MILGLSKCLSPKINVETKYIRIGFVLSVLFAGFGLRLYLILWTIKLLTK